MIHLANDDCPVRDTWKIILEGNSCMLPLYQSNVCVSYIARCWQHHPCFDVFVLAHNIVLSFEHVQSCKGNTHCLACCKSQTTPFLQDLCVKAAQGFCPLLRCSPARHSFLFRHCHRGCAHAGVIVHVVGPGGSRGRRPSNPDALKPWPQSLVAINRH